MYVKIVSLVLCLTLFGSTLAAIGKAGLGKGGVNKPGRGKSASGRGSTGNGVPGGNPGFESNPGGALFPAGSETIDIDANEGNVAGSSGDQFDDDEGSGPDAEGSGGGLASLTPCADMKRKIELRAVQGQYEPMCTDDGFYRSRQCDRQMQCWCVTKEGDPTTSKSPRYELTEQECERATGRLNNVEVPFKEKPNKGEEESSSTKPEDPDIGYGSNGDHKDDIDNSINQMPDHEGNGNGEHDDSNLGPNGVEQVKSEQEPVHKDTSLLMGHPGILAGIIGGAVVGLLCAVLLVMFIVYRMRKKDEGSYALDEPRKSPTLHGYRPANQKEYYA